ncbi:hypothetical protein syc1705_d [Synechococcus elongatus PCC 6301]|uniref:F420-0:Gamma-glutamyl ligase n=1 Tax=Synechococcus sp. (strain ATCC 27144 / PCC 6301 / SAUG 1402/1) TaxID=269084 RepID=A0A0H3K3W1_SYNP6|nr:hypothetical protein syc1705_d [Synechococcus elongatus PCC 6301]
MPLLEGLIGVGIAIAAIGVGLEVQYQRREGNKLEVTNGQWQTDRSPGRLQLTGRIELINRTRKLEIMVPELVAKAKLLSKQSLEGIRWQTRVVPEHEDAAARANDYWFAYIVKKRTTIRVELDIEGPEDAIAALESAWLQLRYVTYGPQGRIPRRKHIVLALKELELDTAPTWRSLSQTDRLPIKTHLLTPQDDPVEVVKRYVLPYSQPGDLLAIGETPLAIMQERFRHPRDIKPGWVARHVCYYFQPTSSLATAVGLQTLVDAVGPWRVFGAFLGGVLLRLVGKRGGFYILAGEQARLIDDVTGSLPPYDQFVVLGPQDPQAVVDRIERETGLKTAIVDVNDLKAVKILAASAGLPTAVLESALRDNPAGNADEQTPIVLVRPR